MNRRYLLTSLKVSLLAVLIAAIGASHADAADKIYPGSQCVRWSGPVPVYTQWGAIGNPAIGKPGPYNPSDPTANVLRVTCPAINSSSLIRKSWVRAIDRNKISGRDVMCTLYSTAVYSRDSFVSWSGGWASTTSSSPNVAPLSFPWGASSSGHSHHYYDCDIPPKETSSGNTSYIVTYEVTD